MTRVALWMSVALFSLLVACGGDDDDDDDDNDADPGDSGMMDGDTAVPVDTGTDTRPDADSSTGAMCPAADCDVVSNAGCGAGEACYYASLSASEDPSPMCLPVGTKGDGESCESLNECQEGSFCFIRIGNTTGVCRHYCCGDRAVCPGRAQLCDVAIAPGIFFCDEPETCDLIDQSGCEEAGTEYGCYLVSQDGALRCLRSTENGEQGDECEAANACAPGFVCAGTASGGASRCQRFCSLSTCLEGGGGDAGAGDAGEDAGDAGTAGGCQCDEGLTCAASLNIPALPDLGVCRM